MDLANNKVVHVPRYGDNTSKSSIVSVRNVTLKFFVHVRVLVALAERGTVLIPAKIFQPAFVSG